jgi:peptidoglycan L-alanyl-D-glutamate endopeptidase CwlK
MQMNGNFHIILIVTVLLLLMVILLIQNRSASMKNHEPVTVHQHTETVSVKDSVIIDSQMTFEEAISGIEIPEDIQNNLTTINVRYFGFDSLLHEGQLVVAQQLAPEIQEIFNELLAIRFPIEKIIPVSVYHWSDSLSMAENNSSCFNYRTIAGRKKLSDHAFGRAIDINPMQNPYNQQNKAIHPRNAIYDPLAKGTLIKDSAAVTVFLKRGWNWGGNWKYYKDYQHFYKKGL